MCISVTGVQSVLSRESEKLNIYDQIRDYMKLTNLVKKLLIFK